MGLSDKSSEPTPGRFKVGTAIVDGEAGQDVELISSLSRLFDLADLNLILPRPMRKSLWPAAISQNDLLA